jgi:hypothetical protein
MNELLHKGQTMTQVPADQSATSNNQSLDRNAAAVGMNVWITSILLILMVANLGLTTWSVTRAKETPAPDTLNARFDKLESKLTEWDAKKTPAGVTDKLLGSLQHNVLKSLVPDLTKLPKPSPKYSFSSIAILPFSVRPKQKLLSPELFTDPTNLKRFEKEIATASAGLASVLDSDQRYRVVFPDNTGGAVKEEDFMEMAGKLGTDAFVTGEAIRYYRTDSRTYKYGVELEIVLIEVKSGFPVWSNKYDLEGGEVNKGGFDEALVRKNLGPAILKIAEDLLPFAKTKTPPAGQAKDPLGRK